MIRFARWFAVWAAVAAFLNAAEKAARCADPNQAGQKQGVVPGGPGGAGPGWRDGDELFRKHAGKDSKLTVAGFKKLLKEVVAQPPLQALPPLPDGGVYPDDLLPTIQKQGGLPINEIIGMGLRRFNTDHLFRKYAGKDGKLTAAGFKSLLAELAQNQGAPPPAAGKGRAK